MDSRTPATIYRLRVDAQGQIVSAKTAREEARASFVLEEREWSPELAEELRKIYDSRVYQNVAGMWTDDKYATGRWVQWKPFTINPVQHGVPPRASGKPSRKLLGELKHLRQLAKDGYGQHAALARDMVEEIEHTITLWAQPTLIEEES